MDSYVVYKTYQAFIKFKLLVDIRFHSIIMSQLKFWMSMANKCSPEEINTPN